MLEPDTISPRGALAKTLAELWWVILVRGVILLILGCYALLFPGMTIGSFVTVIGLYVIAEGILAIVNGVLGKTPTRLWTIARGAGCVDRHFCGGPFVPGGGTYDSDDHVRRGSGRHRVGNSGGCNCHSGP